MLTIPGKIPITIQPFFWIFALLIGWLSSLTLSGAFLWLIVIFVSLIVHEFGHALTALVFGQKVRIELAAFGGFTYRQGPRLKLWQEFIVVLNGPLSGLILFALSYFIFKSIPQDKSIIHYLLQISVYVNLIWTILNLAPVLPLDGGHLLSIILEAIFGFKGIKIALVIGMIFAFSLCAVFFIMGSFLIGAIFLLLAFESIKSFRFYKMLSSQDRDSNLQEQLKTAQNQLQMGNIDLAVSKFEEIRSQTKEGILYLIATEQIAEIYRKQYRFKEAYELIKPLQASLSPEMIPLFHFLSFANGDYKAVIQVGDQCFQLKPTAETALMNALAYGTQSQSEPAVGWLECALREGAIGLKEYIQKKEFDPIRKDDHFQKFVQSL